MPAGLDGNPDPIVTPARTAVLRAVADQVARQRVEGTPLLVAVDGIDGSGKSTFADEVTAMLRERQLRVVRSTIDSFHNPRDVRIRRGATSPVGFYFDSHNLTALKERLLEPIRAGRPYETAIFDSTSDQAVLEDPVEANETDILVFDGIFALRPEIAEYWDYTIFLDGQQRVDLRRLSYVLDELPVEPIDVVAHVLDWDRKIDRYASGMRYYLDLVDPMKLVDIAIDNNDVAKPVILRSHRGLG